jgi:hypothetical protein
MSERYEYKKVCKSCGKSFIAQTAFIKYCGEKCAKRDYKAQQKAKEISRKASAMPNLFEHCRAVADIVRRKPFYSKSMTKNIFAV